MNVPQPIIGGFNQQRDGQGWTTTFVEYERRLTDDPAVAAAGGISSLPLTGAYESTSYAVEDATPVPEGQARPSAIYQVATPGWFEAAGVPLLAGRVFNSGDRADAASALIISETMARASWPGVALSSVIGRQISSGLTRDRQTVIGIVGDMRQTGLDVPAQPTMYLPQSQFPYPSLSFVVRATDRAANPASLLPVMRRRLQEVDPSLALDEVKSLADVRADSVARQRFGMLITGTFALAALLLATVGLYGVIATGIAQRTKEIGVRIALGATTNNVLGAMMKEGARLTVAGTAIGIAGSLAATRLMRDQLYDVSTTDSSVYLAVASFTAAIAIGATLVPAYRATRVNPVAALRSD